MNTFSKAPFIILTFLIFSACSINCDNDVEKLKSKTINVGPLPPCSDRSGPLESVSENDTLKISIEGTDCGEWGGHREYIFLQRNKDYKIIARFIMDDVPCDKIVDNGVGFGTLDDKTRTIIVDTTKLLSFEEGKYMNLFLQRLFMLYLREDVQANFGSIYIVHNTDSSLNFTYWNSGDCRDTYYDKLRNKIFGDLIKKQK